MLFCKLVVDDFPHKGSDAVSVSSPMVLDPLPSNPHTIQIFQTIQCRLQGWVGWRLRPFFELAIYFGNTKSNIFCPFQYNSGRRKFDHPSLMLSRISLYNDSSKSQKLAGNSVRIARAVSSERPWGRSAIGRVGENPIWADRTNLKEMPS